MKKNRWAGSKQIGMTVLFGMIFLICSCVNGGMSNTVMPAVCRLRGWDYAAALPFMSYGGYIGAIATLAFGQLVVKKGAKFVIVLGLILGSFSIALYGSTASFTVFVAAIIGNRVFSCAYQQAGAASMLNSWFPRTKGIVLGWATMGIILADVVWSPYIPKAIVALGLSMTLKLVGLVFLGVAVIVICFTKDTPEEAGAYPDNDPEGLDRVAFAAACAKGYKSPFTWKKLLKTRQVWQIGFTWGMLWMVSVAFVSQVVGRAVSVGYGFDYGIRLLQISSVVALAGSWFFGWLDVEAGTKKASVVFAAVIAILFLSSLLHRQSGIFLWISTCGIMACAGGIANLAPSMVGTVFGRWDFPAANRLISPLIMAVSSSAFALAAFFLHSSWGYDGLYMACAVISALCLISVFLMDDRMIGTTDQEVKEMFMTDRTAL